MASRQALANGNRAPSPWKSADFTREAAIASVPLVAVDADAGVAVTLQPGEALAGSAADVEHLGAEAKTRPLEQLPDDRSVTGPQPFTGRALDAAAAEQSGKGRGLLHHLSSSVCSTFSIRPEASSSDT